MGDGRGVSMDFPSKSFEVVLCQRRDFACRPAKAVTSRLGRTNFVVTDILSSLSLFVRKFSTRLRSFVHQVFNRLNGRGCGLMRLRVGYS